MDNKEKRRLQRKKYYYSNIEKCRQYAREYYYKHKDAMNAKSLKYLKENKKRMGELWKVWFQKNKKARKIYQREYIKNHPELRERNRLRAKKWRLENPERSKKNMENYQPTKNAKRRIRIKEEPLYKLECNLRRRVAKYFQSMKIKKKANTIQLLGADYKTIMEHIEAQFSQDMSWNKLGSKIHIDHIIPLASAKNEEDLLKLFHYKNLQPLWAVDNIAKNDKIIM